MVIFQRGEFSLNDARMASYSLMAYGSGLLSFMLIKILAPAFYSRQDTKTPVKYGIITMVCNMVFNLILAIPFGYVGLALATALSGTLNAVLLYRRLSSTGIYTMSADTLRFNLKVTLSAALMGLAIYWLNTLFIWDTALLLARIYMLTGLVALGISVFAFSLLLFGIRPRHLIIQKLT